MSSKVTTTIRTVWREWRQYYRYHRRTYRVDIWLSANMALWNVLDGHMRAELGIPAGDSVKGWLRRNGWQG